MKKEYEFIEIWKYKISERMWARISRMLDPTKEKEFFISEEYLRKGQSKEEYKKESKRRLQIKKDDEKYFLNAEVLNWNNIDSFLTKGFSISRKEIPKMIEALQNIVDGGNDDYINKILIESGIMKESQQETQVEDTREENKTGEIHEGEGEFGQWYESLSSVQKTDVKAMKRAGWSEDEITAAFKIK